MDTFAGPAELAERDSALLDDAELSGACDVAAPAGALELALWPLLAQAVSMSAPAKPTSQSSLFILVLSRVLITTRRPEGLGSGQRIVVAQQDEPRDRGVSADGIGHGGDRRPR